MNNNLNDYKTRAKCLKQAVSSVFDIECSLSQAYELLAKEENYPNWDALSASINKITIEKSTLTHKEQIQQLFLLYEGIRNGCTFSSIVNLLKEQPNPIIKQGWSNVTSEYNSKNSLDIFIQTDFFSEEVLSVLKINIATGFLENGIRSTIEFFKMS